MWKSSMWTFLSPQDREDTLYQLKCGNFCNCSLERLFHHCNNILFKYIHITSYNIFLIDFEDLINCMQNKVHTRPHHKDICGYYNSLKILII
jgi:hypothetical protein